MNLEKIASKMVGMNMMEMETLLYSLGRERHLKYETQAGYTLSKKEPERFFKVGKYFYVRKPGVSDAEYRRACISNATYLYERFPLIFEFYDELANGIVQKGPALDVSGDVDSYSEAEMMIEDKTPEELMLISASIKDKSIGEQESYLKGLGFKQNIKYETGDSEILSKRERDRFYRVGSMTLSMEKYPTSQAYINACVINACYLYERFPIVFEFYDVLTKGVLKEHTEGKKR